VVCEVCERPLLPVLCSSAGFQETAFHLSFHRPFKSPTQSIVLPPFAGFDQEILNRLDNLCALVGNLELQQHLGFAPIDVLEVESGLNCPGDVQGLSLMSSECVGS